MCKYLIHAKNVVLNNYKRRNLYIIGCEESTIAHASYLENEAFFLFEMFSFNRDRVKPDEHSAWADPIK